MGEKQKKKNRKGKERRAREAALAAAQLAKAAPDSTTQAMSELTIPSPSIPTELKIRGSSCTPGQSKAASDKANRTSHSSQRFQRSCGSTSSSSPSSTRKYSASTTTRTVIPRYANRPTLVVCLCHSNQHSRRCAVNLETSFFRYSIVKIFSMVAAGNARFCWPGRTLSGRRIGNLSKGCT